MATLAEILREKGSDVLEIEAGATVFEAITRMVEANVGALLVLDDGAPAGIFTERDYLRRVAVEGRTSKGTLVREIMSSPLIAVPPTATVEECMALMTDRRIRHTPVIDGGSVVGLVSIGDLVKFQVRLQSRQISFLEDYNTAR